MSRRFDSVITALVSGVLALAVVPLPLAMIGLFRPVPVVLATAAAWGALWWMWQRGQATEPAVLTRGALIAAVLVILVTTALNVAFSSEDLLTERDPGTYNVTGRTTAVSGELLVDSQRDIYHGLELNKDIVFGGPGFYDSTRRDGKLYPQFSNGYSTALGAVSFVATTAGMLKMNAILGGIALLVFFALLLRFLSPWLAVGATTGLAVNLIQMHLSRDSYSEIFAEVLFFGALWALAVARPSFDARRAVFAGLLFGTGTMIRVDAFVVFFPLAAYAVYELWSARPDELQRVWRFVVCLAAATIPPSVIALLAMRLFSPNYLHDRIPELIPIAGGILMIGIAGVIARATSPAARERGLAITAYARRLFGNAVAAAIILGGIFALFVRPRIEVSRDVIVNNFLAHLQAQHGLPVDGRRTYAELTMHWILLYVGIVALVLGVIGIALMVRALIERRDRVMMPFVLIALSESALYLWRPAITPDHLWALRRFIPVTIPAVYAACFWLIGHVVETRRVSWMRFGAIAAGVAVIAQGAWFSAHVVKERTDAGTLAATQAICDRLPDDAAVLVSPDGLLGAQYTSTVRGLCSVPAATMSENLSYAFYQEFARRWHAQGRELFYISPHPFPPNWPAGGAELVARFSFSNLQRTLDARPAGYDTRNISLYVKRVTV